MGAKSVGLEAITFVTCGARTSAFAAAAGSSPVTANIATVSLRLFIGLAPVDGWLLMRGPMSTGCARSCTSQTHENLWGDPLVTWGNNFPGVGPQLPQSLGISRVCHRRTARDSAPKYLHLGGYQAWCVVLGPVPGMGRGHGARYQCKARGTARGMAPRTPHWGCGPRVEPRPPGAGSDRYSSSGRITGSSSGLISRVWRAIAFARTPLPRMISPDFCDDAVNVIFARSANG